MSKNKFPETSAREDKSEQKSSCHPSSFANFNITLSQSKCAMFSFHDFVGWISCNQRKEVFCSSRQQSGHEKLRKLLYFNFMFFLRLWNCEMIWVRWRKRKIMGLNRLQNEFNFVLWLVTNRVMDVFIARARFTKGEKILWVAQA